MIENDSMLSKYLTEMGEISGDCVYDHTFQTYSKHNPIKNVTEEEKTELSNLLNQYSRDSTFNEIISYLFTSGVTGELIKNIIRTYIETPTIDAKTATDILVTCINASQNINIKLYLNLLILQPEQLINYISSDLVNYNLSTVGNPIKCYMSCKEMFNKALQKYIISNSPSLLSFLCQNDINSIHSIYNLNSSSKVVLDDVHDFHQVHQQLQNMYKQLHPPIEAGNNTLQTAVKYMCIIAPYWDRMQANVFLKDDNSRTPCACDSNVRFSSEEIVSIFAGNYSSPSISSFSNMNNISACCAEHLIVDIEKFSILPTTQQQALSEFLVCFRDKFNKIIMESARVIYHCFNDTFTKGNINNLTGGLNIAYIPTNRMKGGAAITDDIKTVIAKLARSWRNYNCSDDRITDLVGWIIHVYLPVGFQFKQHLILKSDKSFAKTVLNKMLSNEVLSIMGIFDDMTVTNYEQLIAYKPKSTISMQSPSRYTSSSSSTYTPSSPPTTIRTEYVSPVQSGILGGSKPTNTPNITKKASTEDYDDYETQYKYITGSDSTTDYATKLIEGQRKFNNKFEDIYRKMIKALNTISAGTVKLQSTQLYNICNLLDDISIKSPKTTVWLSGFIASRNYNRIYLKIIEDTLSAMKEAGSSLFSPLSSLLSEMKSLLNSSAEESRKAINSFITTPKNVSETIMSIAKKVKLPCNLTENELQSFVQGVKRVRNVITDATNETNIYNSKKQFTDYLNNVKDRSQQIEDYYKSRLDRLKLTRSNEDDAVDRMIIEQIKNSMLYLNKELDIKLTNFRAETIKQTNLSEEQINRIEKAFVQFRNYQMDPKFKNNLSKISKLTHCENVDHAQNSNMFKIIKYIKNIWEESGYVSFLIQVYKELKIFDASFNWSDFKSHVLRLLSLVNISLDEFYKFQDNEKLLSIFSWKHYASIKFDKVCSENSNIHMRFLGYQFLQKALEHFNKIPDAYIGVANSEFKFFPNDNDLVNMPDLNEIRYKEQLKTPKHYYLYYHVMRDKDTPPYYWQDPEHKAVLFELLDQGVEFLEQGFPFKYKENSPSVKALTINNKHSNEEMLGLYSIDAMVANVIDVLNKYMSIKYTGNMHFPMRINSILRGGGMNSIDGGDDDYYEIGENTARKVEGASILDIVPIHDNDYTGVIADAAPFYMLAFNMFEFYHSHYSAVKLGNTSKLILNFTKISPLYTVSKLFKQYSIKDVSNMTISQIKTCIGVFNTYWNQTTGNPAEKLSHAVDMLLNEFNACLMYTTKLQFDALKSSGNLNTSLMNVLETNIKELTRDMQQVMTESLVNNNLSGEEQSGIFESYLKNALTAVKSVDEANRLSVIKGLLQSQNQYKTPYREYYKFMDLVITPMLIVAQSYANILSLFNSYTINANFADYDISIDLNELYIYSLDSTGKCYEKNKVGDIIKLVKSDQPNSVKYQAMLVNSGVIQEWNRIILLKTLDELHHSSRFVMPKFWYSIIPETYPSQTKLTHKVTHEVNCNDNVILMQQLWPSANATSIGDFYRCCMNEFESDFDHLLHAFLAYPKINDKLMKRLKNVMHEKIVGIGKPLLLDDKEFQKSIERLDKTKIARYTQYKLPPLYENGLTISSYQSKILIEGIRVSSVLSSSKGSVFKVDGTDLYVATEVDIENNAEYEVKQKGVCFYTWLDWVVYMMARCDRSYFCLPYKLYQAMHDYSALSKVFKEASLDNKKKMAYSSFAGTYYNIVTQNILLRSGTQENQEKTKDLANLNTSWIANMVSIIPYILNTLQAHARLCAKDVMYADTSVSNVLISLMDVLSGFYEELSPYTPFIPYMTDVVGMKSQLFHPIEEIVPHLFIKSNIEATNFTKYEWANQYFFTGLSNKIVFPEYKNQDRFEAIREWAKLKLSDSIFGNEFNTTIAILGRNLWGNIIASQASYNYKYKNNLINLDNIVIQAMNITSELGHNVIERFVNNVIKVFSNRFYGNNTHGNNVLVGGEVSTFGSGDPTEMAKGQEIFKALLEGILSFNSVLTYDNFEASNASIDDLVLSCGYMLNKYIELKAVYVSSFPSEKMPLSFSNSLKDVAQLQFLYNPNNYTAFNKTKFNNTTYSRIINAQMKNYLINTTDFESATKMPFVEEDSFPLLSKFNRRAKNDSYVSRNSINTLKTLDVDELSKRFVTDVYKLVTNDQNCVYLSEKYPGFKAQDSAPVSGSSSFEKANIENGSTISILVNKEIDDAILGKIKFGDEVPKAKDNDNNDMINTLIKFISTITGEEAKFLTDTEKEYGETHKRLSVYNTSSYDNAKDKYNVNSVRKEYVPPPQSSSSISMETINPPNSAPKYEPSLHIDENGMKTNIDDLNKRMESIPEEDVNRMKSIHDKYIQQIDPENTNVRDKTPYRNNDINKRRDAFTDRKNKRKGFKGGVLTNNGSPFSLKFELKYANKTYNSIQSILSENNKGLQAALLLLVASKMYISIKQIPQVFDIASGSLRDKFPITYLHPANAAFMAYILAYGFSAIMIEDIMSSDTNSQFDILAKLVALIYQFDKTHLEGNVASNNFVEIPNKQPEITMQLHKIRNYELVKPVLQMVSQTVTFKYNDSLLLYVPLRGSYRQYLFNPQYEIFVTTCTPVNGELAVKGPCVLNRNKYTIRLENDEKLYGEVYNINAIMSSINTQGAIDGISVVDGYAKTLMAKRVVKEFKADTNSNPTFSDNKTFNVFTDSSTFAFSITNSPIFGFIEEELIKPWFSSMNRTISSYKNTGFANGIGGNGLYSMNGGKNDSPVVLPSTALTDFIINPKSVETGSNVAMIYSKIYSVEDNAISFMMYNNIFKSIKHDATEIFSLMINYFHKYPVSFNSIYNSFIYPSILFNSSALRSTMKNISQIMKSDWENYNDDGYWASFSNFVKLYFKAFVLQTENGDRYAMDITLDPAYQVKFNNTERIRDNNMTYSSQSSELNTLDEKLQKENSIIYISNQFTMPSTSASFMGAITSQMEYWNNNLENDVSYLLNSNLMSDLRHTDCLMTYFSTFFSLVRDMSYFSIDYNSDVSYTGNQSPEPFSGIVPE